MTRAFDRHLRVAAVAALIVLGFAGRVYSQTPQAPQTPVTNTWSHGTTLELFAGAAHATPNTPASTVGAAVGWELNHLAEVEGVAAWLPEQSGAQSFAADLKLLVNLTHPARVVPYVGAGAGLYRASFDATRVTLPSYYQQRMTGFSTRARATFTDPTVVIAGGANVFMASHFSGRPEVGVRLVTRGSGVYTVTAVSFALIYHVENHPEAH